MLINYKQFPNQTILCIDMKSFYASCSSVILGLDPRSSYVTVVGDKEHEGSIVLASSPKMKEKYGIKTGARKFEVPSANQIQVVNPKMRTYVEVSTSIVRVLQQYAPAHEIHIYSVDECFLRIDKQVESREKGFEIGWQIYHELLRTFQLPCSIGIGPNMLLSKLCLDLEAKKKGISYWSYEDVPHKLWPVSPLREMWGIGSKVEKTLHGMGIYTVGQLANFSLEELEKTFGVMGNQLYYHAWGIDCSELGAPILERQISFGKSQVLMRDYTDVKEILCVVYEMCEEVARRTRNARKAGRTVHFGLAYSRNEGGGGFSRSITLEEPTNITKEIYGACVKLFLTFYKDKTVRQIHLSLHNICSDEWMQENLFMGNRSKARDLGYTVDHIRNRFGSAALLRAISYTNGGTARSRSKLLGGHKS